MSKIWCKHRSEHGLAHEFKSLNSRNAIIEWFGKTKDYMPDERTINQILNYKNGCAREHECEPDEEYPHEFLWKMKLLTRCGAKNEFIISLDSIPGIHWFVPLKYKISSVGQSFNPEYSYAEMGIEERTFERIKVDTHKLIAYYEEE